MIVELCTDGQGDFDRIQSLGIERIELCSALEIGGLTPSYSIIKNTRENFQGEIFAMLRPRGGDFCYTDEEIEWMKEDMRVMSDFDIDGVVFGLLNENSEIDLEKNKTVIEYAKNLDLKTTFHRAIDLTNDLIKSGSEINQLGFDYILSSGGKQKALDGKDIIKQLNTSLKTSTQLLVGSGINASQIEEWKESGIQNFHFTAYKVGLEIPLNMGSNTTVDYQKMEDILNKINV